MPRLWDDTIEAHRHTVRHAILSTAWDLATEHGPLSISMSQVAERVGIGRATLYKYFPDVEAMLLTAHDEHVAAHLTELAELAESDGDVSTRLRSVVQRYALLRHHRARHAGDQLSALVHRPGTVAPAEQRLRRLFTRLIAAAQADGQVRDDLTAAELAGYVVHALAAAGDARSKAAVSRLVELVLTGLRP